jgi:hypothetical protein
MKVNIANSGNNFSTALEHVKKGARISRASWEDYDVFVVYQKGYPEGISCNKQTAEAWGMKEGDKFICNPYLQIQNKDGSHSMWTPTIDDILANDWSIVLSAEAYYKDRMV